MVPLQKAMLWLCDVLSLLLFLGTVTMASKAVYLGHSDRIVSWSGEEAFSLRESSLGSSRICVNVV